MTPLPDTPAPAHAPALPGLALHAPRGIRPGGQRAYNERVLLQAVRLQGALTAADLARLTQLSPQAVSQISQGLLADGLLQRGPPLRGRVGQPAVPLSLNPDGAWSVGVKIGRRGLDLLLVDFTGAVRLRHTCAYDVPEAPALLAEMRRGLRAVQRHLGPARAARVQGVGLAAPRALDGWQALLGLPPAVAAGWAGLDLQQAVQRLSPWPVTLAKDTAAACVAERMLGGGRQWPSFHYVFVDTFVGGSVMLDGRLPGGVQGNAGALGSLPLGPVPRRGSAPPPQLLAVASLLTLERAWAAAGLDTTADQQGRALAGPWAAPTRRWLRQAGPALAQALVSASCVLDLPVAVIDGNCSAALLQALVDAVRLALPRLDSQGLQLPAVQAGQLGGQARALGGALLPLHLAFAPDPGVFVRV